MNDAGIVRFTLRLPKELQERLQRLADRDMRSLHAEIVFALTRFADEQLAQADDRQGVMDQD